MNYLLIAITAYLLNAASVTIDKILLVKKLPNPALYVFYISLFSLSVLFLAPFTTFPNSNAFAIASASTILWTLGAYFMFKALKSGEAARVIPIIGSLIPIILLFMSSVSGSINANELFAVLVLLLGLVFLILPSLRGKFSWNELLLEVISALLFANSYFLLKVAYDSSSFLSIFVYSRLILIPFLIVILAFPLLRKYFLTSGENQPKVHLWSLTGLLLFIGQAAGGASQMLLNYAISLTSPAIVNSIQGIQYVFLFILTLFLAKKFPQAFGEKLTRLSITGKVIGIILIFFGLWILSLGTIEDTKPKTGITFSARYASDLGLDPKEVYTEILTDLKPKIIRLPVYWDEVEKEKDLFDFSKTEEYLKLTENYNTEVILVVGFKQPRWPECFHPDWTNGMSNAEFDEEVYSLVETQVKALQKFSSIKYWQVENEPFVDFGICPKPNPERLNKEVEIVKSLDPRPVLITDSGELSSWVPTIGIGDVFGTTLYRTIWSPYFGSVNYPLPPIFYTIKANIAKVLTNSTKSPTIISELQAEPWPDNHLSITEISLTRQAELFPKEKLFENFKYAKETNLGPIVFWGVEWWYYMKVNHVPDFWEIGKVILNH